MLETYAGTFNTTITKPKEVHLTNFCIEMDRFREGKHNKYLRIQIVVEVETVLV